MADLLERWMHFFEIVFISERKRRWRGTVVIDTVFLNDDDDVDCRTVDGVADRSMTMRKHSTIETAVISSVAAMRRNFHWLDSSAADGRA